MPRQTDMITAGFGGNVLLFSMRQISDLVAYSMAYEFEDVVAEVTGADRIDARETSSLKSSRRAYKYLRLASGSQQLARRLSPSPEVIHLARDYELFFPVFNDVHDVFAIRAIANWRQRCRVAACLITEVWAREAPEYVLELLSQFDHIFIGMRNAGEIISRIAGRPVHHLPMAADVMRFSPWPNPPVRSIDVCNVGRRSPITHDAFISLAMTRKISYYYDTFVGGMGKFRNQRTFRVERADQHRLLLSTVLQRSRYYIANRSRINQPDFTGEHEEMSVRFYEGTAAGCVLLGEAPRSEEFRTQLGWEDAVIPMPFDAPDVARLLEELEGNPERMARARRSNASSAALKNDWLHRLQVAFDIMGIPYTEGMHMRQARLEAISRMAAAG